MDNNYLQHYGVLGMKWGVRRMSTKLDTGGLKNKKSKDDDSADNTKHKTVVKPQKGVKEMTDEELNSKIRRIELEKRYNELLPQDISKGKAAVNRVLDNMIVPAAEDVGKQVVKSLMTKAVNKTFNFEESLKVYTNNKKK